MAQQVRHVMFRNTAWNYLGMFVSLSTGLVLVPFLVRYLGSTQYGIWVLVNAVIGYAGYVSVLDHSLGAALMKWVAEYRAERAQEEMSEFVSTVFVVYLAMGMFTLVLTSVVATFVDQFFTIPPEYAFTARLLVLVVGSGVAVNFPMSTFGGILAAYQRYDIANALTIASLLLSAVLMIGLLMGGYGLASMALVQIGVMLFAHGCRIYAVRRINPFISVSIRRFRYDRIRMIRRYASFILVGRMAEQLASRTDEIVIGVFLPVSAITPYSIGLKLNNAVRMFSGQLSGVVFPVAADLHAGRDMERLRRLAIGGTRVTMVLGLPAVLCIAVLARPIISLWIGGDYPEAPTVTMILLVATLVAMIHWVVVVIAEALGKVQVPSVVASAEALINLILSIVLIQKFGIIGVALGTAIPGVISHLFVHVPYACRVLGIPIWTFARKAIIPPALTALPVLLTLYVYSTYAVSETAIGLIGGVAGSLLLYWGLFVSCCVPRDEIRGYALGFARLLLKG